MYRSMHRGFAVLPALVFVALLSVAAIGVETLAPGTDPSSQTASLGGSATEGEGETGGDKSTTAPATPPETEAPISCAAAKEKAFDKQDDGEAISIADKGDIGALDKCHGAILIKGKKPSKNPSDYQCVGRVGTANIEPGRVTSVTNPSRVPDSKDGECAISVCKMEGDKKVCKPAELFKGGVEVSKPTAADGAPALTSSGGVAPTQLSAEQAQGIYDAFGEQAAAQAEVVKEAQQAVDAAEKAASVQGTATQERVLAEAKAKLDAEKAKLAAIEAQKKFFADNVKELKPKVDPLAPPGPPGPQGPPGPPGPQSTFPPPPGSGAPPGGFMDQLMKALGGGWSGGGGGGSGGGEPETCATDSAALQQQQQKYQQQREEYQSALDQYNYELRLNAAYGDRVGAPTRPEPPKPCKPGGGGGSGAAPKAELSCQPKVADVGMAIALAWGCSIGKSVGQGFDTGGALSGSTSITLPTPPIGTNTASFGLTCANLGVLTNAQCSVQVAKPFSIFVANPKTVAPDGVSVLGWLTGGMKSCVVSSPDQVDFTARNASNMSTSGVASTSPIVGESVFLLQCETLGGGVREATTTITITP